MLRESGYVNEKYRWWRNEKMPTASSRLPCFDASPCDAVIYSMPDVYMQHDNVDDNNKAFNRSFSAKFHHVDLSYRPNGCPNNAPYVDIKSEQADI